MNNTELFNTLTEKLGIIKNTNQNIYILNYGNAYYKIILTLPPFNINDLHNDFFSPIVPTLDLTIFNANIHMLNVLLEQLQHTPNNEYAAIDSYNIYTYIWININHYVNTVLYNIYTLSLLDNTDNIIVKFYNNDSIVNTYNNDLNNNNSVNNVPNINNTLPINTLNTANIDPIVPIGINSDILETIKNIDIALYIWFDKYVIIEPTAYISKKDAYIHYKNTAIANMLEPMKLQEFYNAMKTINITTERINNTSAFVGVKLK